MRKYTFASVIFVSLLFSSCVTDSFIPGRKSAVNKNLYQEYLNIGDAYYELKKYDKALEYYNKASENKAFRWACTYKIADTYFKQGNWDEAEKSYLKLIKRDEKNLQLKESLAFVYASKGQFKEALDIYSELEDSFSENQAFLENQIVLLVSIGNEETARVKIENLKTLFPDNTKVETYFKKLDEDKAAREAAEKTEDGEALSTEESESPSVDGLQNVLD